METELFRAEGQAEGWIKGQKERHDQVSSRFSKFCENL
jgi:hypothetical protein